MIGLCAAITLIKCRKKEKLSLKIKDTAAASCYGLYRFSKAEIKRAIRKYGEKKEKCFGVGGSGRVYKGTLPSGQIVAIKQYLYKCNNSNSFIREFEALSRVRHSNIVSLIGYCVEDGEHYLAYEYCSYGNLAQHLLRKETVLTWELRVKILRDCALALKYLHNHVDGCIVHRDIKLNTILLTEEFNPKLSEFGLAKMLGIEESHVYTDVRGEMGYMDPEYMTTAMLTSASDIYSFGIVILQLLSGQKLIDLDLHARDQLTLKAKDVSMMRRPIADFQDPMMKGDLIGVEFEYILLIGVMCIDNSRTGRPTIDLVYEELDKAYTKILSKMVAAKDTELLIG